jgi:ribonuclease HI/probable phosphoglycerate mutase
LSAAGPCKLFTDGASRGNPGQAGAGAVLFADNGEELVAKSIYLGTCTNNVAEYKALLIGLEEAARLGCSELAIALDSELIVRQIQGRYKVKNETLAALFAEVRDYLAGFGKWTIMHVPRAQNARADELANKGIDQRDDQE